MAERQRRYYDSQSSFSGYDQDDLNGYYDPAISEALIAKEVAKQLKRTPSRIRRVAKEAKRVIGLTFAQKHLWWIFPLFVWIVGMFALYYVWKAWMESTFGKAVRTWAGLWMVIPIPGQPGWWNCFLNPQGWMGTLQELIGLSPDDEQKSEIESFAEQMKILVIIWSIVCFLLAIWLYSKKQEREMMGTEGVRILTLPQASLKRIGWHLPRQVG